MQHGNPGKIPGLICAEWFPLNSALEFQQTLIMTLNIFSLITSYINISMCTVNIYSDVFFISSN